MILLARLIRLAEKAEKLILLQKNSQPSSSGQPSSSWRELIRNDLVGGESEGEVRVFVE